MRILILLAQGLLVITPLVTAKINRDTAFIQLLTELVKATNQNSKQ